MLPKKTFLKVCVSPINIYKYIHKYVGKYPGQYSDKLTLELFNSIII